MRNIVEKAYQEAQQALAESEQAKGADSISDSLAYALRVISTAEDVIVPTMLTPAEFGLNEKDIREEFDRLRVDAYRAAVSEIIASGKFVDSDFSKSMAAFMLAYLMKSGQTVENAVDVIASIAEAAQLDLEDSTK